MTVAGVAVIRLITQSKDMMSTCLSSYALYAVCVTCVVCNNSYRRVMDIDMTTESEKKDK